MPDPRTLANPSWSHRLRGRLGERALAVLLSLAIEAVLILAILSLGWAGNAPRRPGGGNLVSVDFAPDRAASPAPARAPSAARAVAAPQQPATPAPAAARMADAAPPLPRPLVTPSTAPRPFITLSGGPLDISRLPRQPGPAAPARKQFGPAGSGASPGDSRRIGTAPNGQPMYAAAWYREPYPDELAGYLSTADGPGWATIACRTAPDWRVEDCVPLDEYPAGSRIDRAVLAAAWQFRVRPPQVGGVYKVGEWVRIRIDYTRRP